MSWNAIVKRSIELVALVMLFVIIIAPLLGLVLWSVALRWYWPSTLPQQFGFDYWRQALGLQQSLAVGAVSITDSLWTSILVASICVVLTMILAVPAGYVLAKFNVPGKSLVLFLFLMPMAFPQQPVFVALLSMFTRVDLAGKLEAVILVHLLVSMVFAVWISSSAFKSIPPELEEAARSVGASRLTALVRVTLPLAIPGILASAVYVFLTSLDEFTGTFFVGLPFVTTLPMLLYSSSGSNLQFASVIAIVLLVPSVLFMVLLERFLKAEYIGGG